MERSPSAIKPLDGLRGIAILLVLFRHAIHPFYKAGEPGIAIGHWDLMIPMANGWMGVDLFFVLSGFLVTHHLLKRSARQITRQDVSDYLVRRFLRIVPAYYTVLILIVCGCIPGYSVSQEGLSQQFANHLLFLQDYRPSQLMAAFWSLGVEEKFYFTIPFVLIPLLKIGCPKRRVRAILILMAVPLLCRIGTYLSQPELADSYVVCFWSLRSPFHLAADSLLVGTLCAFLYHDRSAFPLLQSHRLQKCLFAAGVVLVSSLLFSHELLREISWFDATLLFPALAVGFGAVLLSIVLRSESNVNSTGLSSSWLFFFSKISYSLYLVHMLFIDSVYHLCRSIPGFDQLSQGGQFLVYFPVYAMVSIAASLLLHYVIEKPFLLVKDRPRQASRSTVPVPAQ